MSKTASKWLIALGVVSVGILLIAFGQDVVDFFSNIFNGVTEALPSPDAGAGTGTETGTE